MRTRSFRGVLGALRDKRAVAAVEFAIVLPVMLILYLGGSELSHALTIARKVTHSTSSLADLLTQLKTVSSTEMCNIIKAAEGIMIPYPTSAMRIKLTGLTITGSVAKVDWGAALHDTPAVKGTTITVPAGIKTSGTSLVTVEVHYPYTPTFGYVFTNTFDLNDQFFLSPRLTASVTGPGDGTFTCS